MHLKEILSQIQSMQKSLEDVESWKEEVHLPEGAENLLIFSKARMLLEQLEGLEQITREKSCLLEVRHVLGRDYVNMLSMKSYISRTKVKTFKSVTVLNDVKDY